ncbi:MAG: DUF697 domain-containing protein [Bacteroidia bacterium]|nr:DUF697 domain-containing protein [Bacteroidia bacterium]
MADFSKFVPLVGSEHVRISGEKKTGGVDLEEIVEFSMYLRADPAKLNTGEDFFSNLASDLFMNEEPIPVAYDDYLLIREYAEAYNLEQTDPEMEEAMQAKVFNFRARAGDVNNAFKTKLVQKTLNNTEFLSYNGFLSVPQELEEIIIGVFGLDDSPGTDAHGGLEFDKVDSEALQEKILENLERLLKFLGDKVPELGDLDPAEMLEHFGRLIKPSLKDKQPVLFKEFLDRSRTVFPTDDKELFERKFLQQSLIMRGIPFKYAHTVPEITQMNQFPEKYLGKGQTIGIISLFGGYLKSDLELYFRALDMKMPEIEMVSVDRGTNDLSEKSDSYNLENTLDIAVAAAAAPEAKIVVYCANGEKMGFFNSFINAVQAAVNDNVNKPSTVSISWSDTEMNWQLGQLKALNRIFWEGVQKGITFFASSGNYGARGTNSPMISKPQVRFPASSPYVIACSGTTTLSDALRQNIVEERVFNDPSYVMEKMPFPMASGGGYSSVFLRPLWQADEDLPESINQEKSPMRAVPDVTFNANMITGYPLYLRGSLYPVPVGGTSSSAPVWAALIARINQARNEMGKKLVKANLLPAEIPHFNIGYLHPRIYNQLKLKNLGGFRDIKQGHNLFPGLLKWEKYDARPEKWDGCTGMGPPNGTRLLELLTAEFDPEFLQNRDNLKEIIKVRAMLRAHNPDDDVLVTPYAEKIIRKYTLITMGVGLVPLPLLDLAAIAGVQVKMIKTLCELYELDFRSDLVKTLIGAVAGTATTVGIGAPLAGSLLKLVPFVGNVLGAASLSVGAGATTYALGKIFSNHFAYGGTFLDFNPSQAKLQFNAEKEASLNWIGTLANSLIDKAPGF